MSYANYQFQPYLSDPLHQAEVPVILVVDDDAWLRGVVRQHMEASGYRVVEASDGVEGLIAYQQYHPDLVLLDGVMPIMDGFTCCTQLHQVTGGKCVPVLLLTGLDDAASVDRAFAAGATDYITKPIHWALLRQRVQRLLQASQATALLEQQTIVLQIQAERERLLSTVAQRIRQSLNLEEVLQTTVDEVQRLLQADRVLCYQVYPDGTGRVITESVVPTCTPLLGHPLPADIFPQICYDWYRQGRVRLVTDITCDTLSLCLVEALQNLGVISKMVVPILQQETLWGLLIVHQCHAPRHWQDWEAELLKQLATQVAIALQQSQLYQQVKQLNTDLECQVQERTTQLQQALKFEASLRRVTDKVRDCLEESQILQTVVQELGQVLEVGRCSTALYHVEAGMVAIQSEYRIAELAECAYIVEMDSQPDLYRQLLHGQGVQFCPLDAMAGQEQVSIFACPISDDQGVLGDLWVVHSDPAVFSHLEVRLVEQVANQCAIAIRKARLYQTAQAQVAELERLNQLKDDFLSTVSHELRSPVSNMRMAIQMLQQTIAKGSPGCAFAAPGNRAHTYLQILHNECEREITLINDLLDLQRLESGHQALNLDLIYLQEWLSDLVIPFSQRAQERQQQLQLHVLDDLPPFLSDPACLRRVLAELFNNACKYTPPQERIEVAVDRLQNHVRISVTNTGVEIPSQELHRIFEKFYRIPSSDRWKQGGTGLGLALVKRLVGHLGGSVEVNSTSGQTCFTVELPIPATPEAVVTLARTAQVAV